MSSFAVLCYYWSCKSVFKMGIINLCNQYWQQSENNARIRWNCLRHTLFIIGTYNIQNILLLLCLFPSQNASFFQHVVPIVFYVSGNKLKWNKHVQSPLQLRSNCFHEFGSGCISLSQFNGWRNEEGIRAVDYQRRICYRPEFNVLILMSGSPTKRLLGWHVEWADGSSWQCYLFSFPSSFILVLRLRAYFKKPFLTLC